ncbi:WD40-repeat-containing domain protein [Chlamydoabsidia padenii]|nr:WD40-repeat-containing domain protein [Chlamydoabsidia padenii]
MSTSLSQCLWERRCNNYNTSRLTHFNKFSRQVYGDPFFLNRMILDKSLRSQTNDIMTSLCWSSQGDSLLSGSCSGQLYLWKPFESTQCPNIVLSTEEQSLIHSVNYMSKNRAICGSESGTLWLFDLDSGDPLEIYSCSKASTRLEINGNNEVVSCSEDGIIRQYDLRERHVCDNESDCKTSVILDYSQSSSIATMKGDPVRLQSISIDPFAPHYLAVAGSQNYVYLHDRRMHGGSSLVNLLVNENGTATSQNELCYGNACKFSNKVSGSLLVNWSDDNIYLFDIHNNEKTTVKLNQGENDIAVDVIHYSHRYTGHLNPWVNEECIGFYGLDEEYVISGTDDGMVFIWNRTNEKVMQMFNVSDSPITGIKAHPTLPILAVTDSDSMVKLYIPRSEPSLTSPSTHPFAESSYAITSHMFEVDSLVNRNEQLKRGNPSHLFNHLIRNDNGPPPCYIQ